MMLDDYIAGYICSVQRSMQRAQCVRRIGEGENGLGELVPLWARSLSLGDLSLSFFSISFPFRTGCGY